MADPTIEAKIAMTMTADLSAVQAIRSELRGATTEAKSLNRELGRQGGTAPRQPSEMSSPNQPKPVAFSDRNVKSHAAVVQDLAKRRPGTGGGASTVPTGPGTTRPKTLAEANADIAAARATLQRAAAAEPRPSAVKSHADVVREREDPELRRQIEAEKRRQTEAIKAGTISGATMRAQAGAAPQRGMGGALSRAAGREALYRAGQAGTPQQVAEAQARALGEIVQRQQPKVTAAATDLVTRGLAEGLTRAEFTKASKKIAATVNKDIQTALISEGMTKETAKELAKAPAEAFTETVAESYKKAGGGMRRVAEESKKSWLSHFAEVAAAGVAAWELVGEKFLEYAEMSRERAAEGVQLVSTIMAAGAGRVDLAEATHIMHEFEEQNIDLQKQLGYTTDAFNKSDAVIAKWGITSTETAGDLKTQFADMAAAIGVTPDVIARQLEAISRTGAGGTAFMAQFASPAVIQQLTHQSLQGYEQLFKGMQYDPRAIAEMARQRTGLIPGVQGQAARRREVMGPSEDLSESIGALQRAIGEDLEPAFRNLAIAATTVIDAFTGVVKAMTPSETTVAVGVGLLGLTAGILKAGKGALGYIGRGLGLRNIHTGLEHLAERGGGTAAEAAKGGAGMMPWMLKAFGAVAGFGLAAEEIAQGATTMEGVQKELEQNRKDKEDAARLWRWITGGGGEKKPTGEPTSPWPTATAPGSATPLYNTQMNGPMPYDPGATRSIGGPHKELSLIRAIEEKTAAEDRGALREATYNLDKFTEALSYATTMLNNLMGIGLGEARGLGGGGGFGGGGGGTGGFGGGGGGGGGVSGAGGGEPAPTPSDFAAGAPGSTGTAGGKPSMKLSVNQQSAYSAFRALGYDDKAARIAVGNLSGESLRNPADVHADPSSRNPGQVAQGIASWDQSRSARIQKQFGKLPKDMTVAEQVTALDWEMKNYYKKAYADLHNPNLTDEQRMYSVVKNFESPRDPSGQAAKRMGLMAGMNVSDAPQGSTAPPTGEPGPGGKPPVTVLAGGKPGEPFKPVQAVGGESPAAFIMHHTGGRGSAAGVQNTLNRRGLGVQYVMDREGNISQIGGEGASNIRKGQGVGAGLSNANIVGMEVIAKNDKDINEAQVKAAQAFIQAYYPSTPVYGHGAVNPHKQETEGKTIADAIAAQRKQLQQAKQMQQQAQQQATGQQQLAAMQQRNETMLRQPSRDPTGMGYLRDPASQLAATPAMQLGRGKVDVQLKLDKGLAATTPSIKSASQFDVGANIDTTGQPSTSRPGDPTFPASMGGIGHA